MIDRLVKKSSAPLQFSYLWRVVGTMAS